MSEDSTYHKIESYLLQQMTEAERKAFEEEVRNNEKLAQQLEQQKLEHTIMENLIEEDLKKDLKTWQTEINTPSTSSQKPSQKSYFKNSRFLIVIILSILFLLSIYFFSSQNNNQDTPPKNPIDENIERSIPQDQNPEVNMPSSEKDDSETPLNEESEKEEKEEIQQKENQQKPPDLIPGSSPDPTYLALANLYYQANFFEVDKMRNIENSSLAQVDHNLYALDSLFSLDSYKILDKLKITKSPITTDSLKALDSLLNKYYLFCENGLNKLLATNDSDLDLHYKLGLVYYNQRQFANAVPHFQTITKGSHIQIEEVRWLLCLSYFQVGENEEGIKMLNFLIDDPEHFAHSKAVNFFTALEQE